MVSVIDGLDDQESTWVVGSALEEPHSEGDTLEELEIVALLQGLPLELTHGDAESDVVSVIDGLDDQEPTWVVGSALEEPHGEGDTLTDWDALGELEIVALLQGLPLELTLGDGDELALEERDDVGVRMANLLGDTLPEAL